MTTTFQRLAEEARHSAETQATATQPPAYVAEFRSMFTKEDFDILLEHCKWDHTIELTPGAEPKSSKVYPLSLLEQAKLDAFLEENLCTERIRPSKSPIAAPVFFIKKKDGSLWLVQDYCVLNAMTVKNRYPFPFISKLVSQLHGARYFTKLDVCWGFNNICINVRLANSKAGIKPTAPLSAFDKENSIEFPLDFLFYLYTFLTLTLY